MIIWKRKKEGRSNRSLGVSPEGSGFGGSGLRREKKAYHADREMLELSVQAREGDALM